MGAHDVPVELGGFVQFLRRAVRRTRRWVLLACLGFFTAFFKYRPPISQQLRRGELWRSGAARALEPGRLPSHSITADFEPSEVVAQLQRVIH